MEKEEITLIKWHVYHANFPQAYNAPHEYLLLFLNKDSYRNHYRNHFGIIACQDYVLNDTLDIYSSYQTYTIKEVPVEDLPLYINWYQKPLFSRLLKGSMKGT